MHDVVRSQPSRYGSPQIRNHLARSGLRWGRRRSAGYARYSSARRQPQRSSALRDLVTSLRGAVLCTIAIRLCFGLCAAVWLGTATLARAQAVQVPSASGALDEPAEPAWLTRYEHARSLLLDEAWAEAAEELDGLQADARSAQQKLLAEELASLARAKLRRLRSCCIQPELRTNDELAVLYTMGVFYGLGTAAWAALQLQPSTLEGALLPFAVLTPATVGVIAWADSYRPLRHGIPHALAAGMYLGLGEGIWLVGLQSANADQLSEVSRWSAETASTALWLSSTAGALAGGLIGALRRPTPGRVSLAGSAAIWGGVLSAFAASAVEPNADDRSVRAFAVGAIGYNIALVTALLIGPRLAPSVSRVRFTDLGGLLGALLGGGGYSVIARGGDARIGYGLTAIGGLLGLGVAFWATSGMPPDHSHDRLAPAIGERGTAPQRLHTWVSPVRSGVLVGLTYER